MGYVYIMQMGDYFKIGVSNNVEKRRDRIDVTLLPNEVIVIASKKTKDPYILESFLHQEYGLNRIRGEWFSFEKDTVKDIINKYEFNQVSEINKVNNIFLSSERLEEKKQEIENLKKELQKNIKEANKIFDLKLKPYEKIILDLFLDKIKSINRVI